MAGLFEGTPTNSPSSSTVTSEMPKWYQDLTYQQMMAAKTVADQPYRQYELPRLAQTSPDQNAAYGATRQNVGAWQPSMNMAMTGTQALTDPTTGYQQGMNMMGTAGNSGALSQAQPYLQQAGRSSVDNISDYMNPYNSQVTDRIAQLGARNLSENILPNVSDSFIRAGQFGGSRMGEFGSRAVRDTQDSILGQQSQVLQSGYGQAVGAAQGDLSRYGQLGDSVGSLAGSDYSRQLTAGQNIAGVAGSEAIRRQGALQGIADMSQQQQGLYTQDAAALQAIGQEQQVQQQRELDSSYQNYQEQQNYPQTQLDWYQAQLRGSGQYLPQTQNTTANTTTFAPSPLSQLASGYFAFKGLGANQ